MVKAGSPIWSRIGCIILMAAVTNMIVPGVFASEWGIGMSGDLYVNINGDDSWTGRSSLCIASDGPKRTIQAAIDAAVDGEVIVVSPGTYWSNIDFCGKNIVLTSTNPENWLTVEATVIRGDGADSVVSFTNGETNQCVLTGFTITGGYGTILSWNGTTYYYFGGGILCYNASPTLVRNIITGNYGPTKYQGSQLIEASYGGGVSGYFSDAIVMRNIIRGNESSAGGGVLAMNGNMRITDNYIDGNSANIGGGGAIVGAALLANNTISYNEALEAGNLYISFNYSADNIVRNNIISDSVGGGGIYYDGASDTFTYNDVYNNTDGDYYSSEDLTGINGNLSVDPGYIDGAGGDYHLQDYSLCIDAGTSESGAESEELDIDGDRRIMGLRIDLGADEWPQNMADAGPDQSQKDPGMIQLDGSGCFWAHPEGEREYQWSQVSGPAVVLSDAGCERPTFMATEFGEYRFELVISDGVNVSEGDEVVIYVGNRTPIAKAASQAHLAGERTILDGSESYDPDASDVLSYHWEQVEGPDVEIHDADTSRAWFDYSGVGEMVFELAVYDGVEAGQCRVTVIYVQQTQDEETLDIDISADRNCRYPDISGGYVSYAIGSACDYTWSLWDENLLDKSCEHHKAGGSTMRPRAEGNTLVWYSAGDGFGNPWYHEPSNSGIFMYVRGQSQYIRALREWSWTESYSHPAVSGTIVVWLEHLGLDLGADHHTAQRWSQTPYNICGADITNLDGPVYFTIAEDVGRRNPYPCYYPDYVKDFDHVIDISGSIAVWEGNGDIYGADLSDLSNIKVFPICTAAGRQYDPAISGHRVVWTDQRDDEGDIYGADLSDLSDIKIFPIIREAGNQQQPAIDKDMIVYVDGGMSGEIKWCQLVGANIPLKLNFSERRYGTAPTIDGQFIGWQSLLQGFDVTRISAVEIVGARIKPIENITQGRKYYMMHNALGTAQPGDTIVVGPGVYRTNIDFKGKDIRLWSSSPGDWEVVANTVIQGDGTGPVVQFAGTETAACELRGFTITGGVYTQPGQRGGGLSGHGAKPTIRQCIIEGNQAHHCGGMADCEGLVDRCIIRNNSAVEWVGGICNLDGTIRDCLIYGNTAVINAGAFIWHGQILNCTIVNNVATSYAGGVYNDSGTCSNSILWGNVPDQMFYKPLPTYCCIEGWSGGGTGNITDDPRFANAAGENFHVLPSSLCKDAGDPAYVAATDESDIDGNPRVIGGRVDIGADEVTALAGLGDVSGDGRVDLQDFVLLRDSWLSSSGQAEYNGLCDFDGGGTVDVVDLEVMLSNWLNES